MATEQKGSMAQAMANAPKPADKPAPTTPAKPANPLMQYLGSPEFELNANPKWFADKRDATKESQKVALVYFTPKGAPVGFRLEASIYFERVTEQTATGRKRTTYARFSLPRSVKLEKSDDASVYLDGLRDAMVAQFQAVNFAASGSGSGGTMVNRSGG